jgi:hypothetical protein
MATTATDKNDSAGLLTDCGRYCIEQDGALFRWTHSDSGIVVEVSETAAMRRGPQGETITGWVAVARPALDEPVVETIVTDDGYLPSRSETVEAARGWMQRHEAGQLPTTETETESEGN